jgi:glycosyltransferase involved in cell wall biosynthesis
MKIALIVPPFIAVPPKQYGGTELFIASLAQGLKENGVEVVLYSNGESTLPVETRWIYEKEDWPVSTHVEKSLKTLAHCAWAIKDASGEADLIHVNSAPAVSFSRFIQLPMVHTVHHGYEEDLTAHYSMAPEVSYVTISDFQRRKLPMPRMRTIHHGVDSGMYRLQEKKQDYLAFLGRIAPAKGPHLAIEVAKKSGLPLKIAGEIQPVYKEYWESQIKPHVDGKFIEYVGQVDLKGKNELLGKARAMVFPIQWDEPFGLVLIEAMACGTPVLATPCGSVPEIVKDGVSGYICSGTEEFLQRVLDVKIPATTVRAYMEKHFSVERMTRDYIHLYTEILQNGVKEVEQIVA